MTVLPDWPDAERVIADVATGLAEVGNRTPADLQARLPYIRATRVGGDDDGITDRARVSIDVFATSATEAKAIAGTIRQRLLDVPYPIDRAATEVAPHLVPYPDPDVALATGTYRLSVRRAAGA